MISHAKWGAQSAERGRRRDMRALELTPWILGSDVVTPDLARAKHRVDRPGKLASGCDASDPPVEALLELVVVLG